MNKFALAVLFSFFPALAAADGSLSFAPPATDYSVVFLGNLFGIVDGVLHGSGSQIMGSMFAVFNAAVLALGGIIIMYTLIVSTLNTAHEGSLIGKKWSSLWVPVRATLGLALLIPKASGYCLMQIFIMWVVVQGVGAADKVWDAALGYLNRGGTIIQAQTDPVKDLATGGVAVKIVQGAQAMLAGQVCMLGLQEQLKVVRESYLAQKSQKGGPCVLLGTSGNVADFCNTPVPDFISSVNVISAQQNQPSVAVGQSYTLRMPNFTSDSPYSFLNGICGTLMWNRFGLPSNVSSTISNLTPSDIATANMSRAIAVQQMFVDLGLVAQTMVNNDPQIGPSSASSSPPADGLSVAKQPFGVPMPVGSNDACVNSDDTNCTLWGIPSGGGAPLFNGTEFQGAVTDYNGIMLPTLTLVQEAVQTAGANDTRKFIQTATTQGWLMAGSYFFNLINISQQAQNYSGQIDDSSGLDGSTFTASTITNPFNQSNTGGCVDTSTRGGMSNFKPLCQWLSYMPPGAGLLTVKVVQNLIQAPGVHTTTAPPTPTGTQTTQIGVDASTVYGFMVNSLVIHTGAQPGTAPLQFANKVNFNFQGQEFQLPSVDFGCGQLKIVFWSTCFGGVLANIFYNDLLRPIYNALLEAFSSTINSVIELFIVTPLIGMSTIFKQGLDLIDKPGVNPIVALAQMGTFYINFSGNMSLAILDQAIIESIIPPPFDLYIFVLMGMALPVISAWLAVFVGIGFVTAYYVPLLPYMLFTFGGIAWLMAVIEAMVAGPIVALGVTHPEGEGAFGKGEAAIMILLNIFLRPSMMIIGYIAAIALSYVSVWMINAGFDNAIAFVQGGKDFGTMLQNTTVSTSTGNISGGYTDWAGIYAYFFSILMYTSMYMTVVQKSFTLIATLPDKVLRWIGGSPENISGETAGWAEESKGAVKEAGASTDAGQKQAVASQTEGAVKKGKAVGGAAKKGAAALAKKGASAKSGGK